MKKILGLDLGTNSIGWAVVNAETQENETKAISIEAAGSRIIPMDAEIMGKFEAGNSISQTAERTKYRGIRRLLERAKLRRERLNRVLNIMGFLPEHYSSCLNRYGQFIDYQEPKLPWTKDPNGKSVFLFQESFLEMCEDFKQVQPNLKNIPIDWTIYYLRKKALTKAISKQELAWILLQFNQKRGYFQLRGEEKEIDASKKVEYQELKVLKVEADNEDKGDVWYNVYLENGMIYRRKSKTPLDWENKIREFIITTDLNEDGTEKRDKDGNIIRRFRAPKEDDWGLIKVKTEDKINNSNKTIGEYIYDELLNDPDQKIVGKLIRVIERKYYKEELIQILNKQKELGNITELNDTELLNECINALYPNNETHSNILKQKDFTNLFVEDILFYQRPLKSKKSLIADCPYEKRGYKMKDGRTLVEPLKCVVKSHPLFQEFRLWQFIKNLRIYEREAKVDGVLKTNIDQTANYLNSEEDITKLFEFLMQKKEIGQKELLKYFKLKDTGYRWNYVEDKKYPCNTTYVSLLSRIKKAGLTEQFLTKEIEERLWHILYSISSKVEIGKALRTFAEKHSIEDKDTFAEELQKEIFPKEYASYSLKAIRKLLSLMRVGKYWSEEAIDSNTKERIDKLLTGEVDEKIDDKTREKLTDFNDINQFKGLPLWLACYVVYGRHSEAKDITKWESPEDIDNYLRQFKQHSLRNPIVEQIVTETLRTVRDIWTQVGSIDEIHLELGRELKNDSQERKRISEQNIANENTNLRIQKILSNLNESGYSEVRPHSPSQQEIFKIYESYALSTLDKKDTDFKFIEEFKKKADPSKNDIIRYKAWLEQKYLSPYTGRVIPLSKLFTDAYQIEHIIPQSRYFDDSFSNKVICEAEVNQLKDKMLGYEFISKKPGQVVQLSNGESVTLFTVEQYENFVRDHYSGIGQSQKKTKLLLKDIPEDFIQRQLNDTRYISKHIKSLLSNIVREKREDGTYEEEATSKNLVVCTGKITDLLKQDWGMNDVWNRIILPRFQRLNELTDKKDFTTLNTEGHIIPTVPLELKKGFTKKRIDHRHHAMDAIVIACATRNHVNLINNEAAKPQNQANRYQLQYKLREREKAIINGEEREVFTTFYKPWDTFTQDTFEALSNIVVSFKQNLRVINKTTNKTQFYNKDENKIKLQPQEKGDSWAIRKSLHKETVFGEVNLRQIKTTKLSEALNKPQSIVDKDVKAEVYRLKTLGKDDKAIIKHFKDNKDIWSEIKNDKVEVYYFTKDTKDRYFATRKAIGDIVSKKEDIESITDSGIRKILEKHLEANDGNIEKAFSPEGIEEMNRNIYQLNNNTPHKPIYKARKFEKADKFAVGTKGNKFQKFVEAAKGTNLFFAIYEEDEKRTYATVPLNIVIDCQKAKPKEWKAYLDEILKEKEYVNKEAKLLFIISPNDLVYLPTQEELKTKQYSFDRNRIYKFVSCSGKIADFVPASSASVIFSMTEKEQKNKFNNTVKYKQKNKSDKALQDEYGVGSPKSKNEKALTGEMIKETCIPIKVDRLGNIIS